MQGQRSAVGSLPELSFHHVSATSESGIDPQRCWNDARNPALGQPSDCVISSSNAGIAYLNSACHEGHNLSGWSLGESSSSGAQGHVNQNDRMSVCTGAARALGARQHGSLDILSLNVDANQNTEQAANGCLFMQAADSASIPQDHNASSEFAEPNNDDDDCQVIGCVSAFRSGSSTELLTGTSSSSDPFVTASGSGGFLAEGSDGRPSSSLDARRLSCKRKTLEGSAGQSSGSGSSNYFQDSSASFWHAATAHNITPGSIPASLGSNLTVNLAEQVHPRLGLSVGGAASEVPLRASGGAENSRRSFRLRTDPSRRPDCTPGTVSSVENVGGNYNVLPSQRSLRLQPDYNHLDFGPYSETENQSVLRPAVTSLRRNPQSRWYRASSSGAGSSNSAIFGERVALPYEGPNSRSLPADISEHPMFTPSTNAGISYQGPVNWSFSAGNIGTGGNIASSSRIGLNSGVNSPVPSLVPHRNPPQYPRRLSELVRRSLLSSAGTESGGQGSSYNLVHPGPSSSHEIPLPPGSGIHGHHRLHSRSAVSLERHLGSALGIPYSARALAAPNEGRSRLVSEIRNVLDLMRRGEGLRFEDVMILDQSVLFGMADLHDRHRDMRLDVDNMSYEELLALEERIGNVCTGLTEETIAGRLKQRKYVCVDNEEQAEAEPCCICQEEYTDGEDLGTLDCGHDFHTNCVKQWLMHKNSCPICKTAGLTK